MEQTGRLTAAGPASGSSDSSGLGHPTLAVFDAIRAILAATGLPAEPDTYELLYLHVTGADAALSQEVERLLAAGALTPAALTGLRKAHLGEIAAAELLELVEAAQASALALAGQLDRTHQDVRSFDAAIHQEDQALAVARSANELAELVQRLRRANAAVMQSNRRLEADIASTRLETARLIDRLELAERNARTDPLTGLLNRRGVLEALKKAQAKALADGRPLAAAMVDIDHFKRINDQWGHSIGDEVLRCVGAHLQNHARKTAAGDGFVGRFGGEEFVVALPGIALRDAAAALDQARAALARQVLRRSDDGATLGRISFSAGVAAQREQDSADTLLDRADSALYAAKRAGRDRVLPELPSR